MKMPVLERGWPSQIYRLPVAGFDRLSTERGLAFFRSPVVAPPAHEAKQKSCWHGQVSTCLVECQEPVPDCLRIDVPAGERRLCGFDQLCPGRVVNIGRRIDFDPPRENSFVLRVSR